MGRIKTCALLVLYIFAFLASSSAVKAQDHDASDTDKVNENDNVDNILLEDKGKLKLDELELTQANKEDLNGDLKENKADLDVEEIETAVADDDDDVEIFNETDPSNFDPRPVPAETPIQAPPSRRLDARGARNGKMVMDHYDPNNWNSLLSDFAPPESSQRGGGLPYIITEQRLKEIREPMMYWFWDQGGTSENIGDYQRHIHESTKTVHKNLNFQLPFFGFRYNYTRVSLNGMLEFSDPPQMYPSYPLTFPNKRWPKENDPAFIGIFMSSCRVGAVRAEDVDQRRPGVYFRLERDLQTRTDIMGIEMRERVKWDIRTGMIGAETFEPKHVITTTWKNVTFAGGITQSIHKTNTFQIILATDEVFTYCIFNYLDLQWTSHTSAGGDTLSGEGGIAAYVGFNAGNGTKSYEYLPYSQGTVLRDLTGRGWGNGKQGRHIFRIDEKILPGSCNKDIDGANMRLNFAPESGNMLGGTVVNITGPCFERTDRIKCKFDVMDEVIGTVIDINRAICVQPMLFAEGYVLLQIALNSDVFKWKGKYYVETPGSAAEKIYFFDESVHQKTPKEVRITWAKYNLTTNENSPVRISLWGYRETTIRPEFLYIDTLSEGQTNSGEFVIIPGNFRNRDNRKLTDIKFGFIQINLTDSIQVEQSTGGNNQFEITPVIWSRPIPLSWYFEPQWERLYGGKWTEQLCNDWIMKDRFLKNFAHELTQCPCSIEHAIIDKGRFLPDADCDKDSNPKCPYHRGALHCVRTGIPTMEGSEQQCCYDKMGYLMLSYDQQWGSSPRRSHNLGYLPHNEANKVPTLSHWFHDMVPKYLCCRWQEEQSVGCETLRFERRPTQDCVAYQPPAIAGLFGDPHIVTFDDVRYTFNGKGEFVLVRTDDKTMSLDVQGRFEQMPMNAYGEVRATQLTSVVIRGNGTDPAIIEIRQRPEEARWRYRLEVLANGQPVYFDRPSLKFQHFAGATVYTPTYILNQSEVIVMLDSGAGVEVVENRGYMSTRIFLPWTYINKTRGLFGNWSFDMNDDLALPDGVIIPVGLNMNNFASLYTDFGMKWILEQQSFPGIGGSLFTYENGKSSSNYNNRSFIPQFLTSPKEILPYNLSLEINKAYEFCHETYQCLYDYAMTLSKDQAHFTTNYLSTIVNWREKNTKTVVSCGVLETPRFGRKSNFLFIPGTKVTFECNQGFILVGDQRRECTSDGHWDYPMYGYTECLREQEFSSRYAAITFGIIMAIMVPLLIILAYLGKIVYSRYQRGLDPIYVPPSLSGSRMRLDRLDDDMSTIRKDDLSTLDDRPNLHPDLTYRSEQSQDSLNSAKKRRSYDRTYRTGEPIKGLPTDTFADGSEVNYDGSERESNEINNSGNPEYFQSVSNQDSQQMEDSVGGSPLYAIPHKTGYKSATLRKAPPPPVPDLVDTKRSQSNPNLLQDKTDKANYFRQSEQEYSSRYAGLTFGIILAVMIPIILGLVYGGYKFIQKRNEENDLEEEDEIKRRAQEAAALKMRVISDTDSDPKGTMRMNDFDNNQSQYEGNQSTFGKNQSAFAPGNQSPPSEGNQSPYGGNQINYETNPQQQQQEYDDNRVNSPVSQSARTTEIY